MDEFPDRVFGLEEIGIHPVLRRHAGTRSGMVLVDSHERLLLRRARRKLHIEHLVAQLEKVQEATNVVLRRFASLASRLYLVGPALETVARWVWVFARGSLAEGEHVSAGERLRSCFDALHHVNRTAKDLAKFRFPIIFGLKELRCNDEARHKRPRLAERLDGIDCLLVRVRGAEKVALDRIHAPALGGARGRW